MKQKSGIAFTLFAILTSIVIIAKYDLWFKDIIIKRFGENIFNILFVTIFMFGSVYLINRYNLDMDFNKNGTLNRTVTIEGLENNENVVDENDVDAVKKMNEIDPEEENKKKMKEIDNLSDLSTDSSTSFCDKYKSNPMELDNKCRGLTEKSCNATDCCVFINGETCVSGDATGNTFHTEPNSDKDINVKYYYHKGKCYGDECPK